MKIIKLVTDKLMTNYANFGKSVMSNILSANNSNTFQMVITAQKQKVQSKNKSRDRFIRDTLISEVFNYLK